MGTVLALLGVACLLGFVWWSGWKDRGADGYDPELPMRDL